MYAQLFCNTEVLHDFDLTDLNKKTYFLFH